MTWNGQWFQAMTICSNFLQLPCWIFCCVKWGHIIYIERNAFKCHGPIMLNNHFILGAMKMLWQARRSYPHHVTQSFQHFSWIISFYWANGIFNEILFWFLMTYSAPLHPLQLNQHGSKCHNIWLMSLERYHLPNDFHQIICGFEKTSKKVKMPRMPLFVCN